MNSGRVDGRHKLWLGISLTLVVASLALLIIDARRLSNWIIFAASTCNVVLFRQLLKGNGRPRS